MKKILIAVPTVNRSEMVKEVLEYEIPYYKEYDISMCYYDSSTDDKTYLAIKSVNRTHKVKIKYKSGYKDMCLDYKIVEMFKEFTNLEYDYFWLINDSISIYEDMLKYIINIVEQEYDLIRLPLSGRGNSNDYVTEDVNDWFHNCSQGMAHMATTIVSKSLFDMDIDWDKLRDKYVFNNTLDDKHGYFFTVGFYLEQILRLKHFKGILIGNHCIWRRDSDLKKNQIYWYKYVFETWAKSYPETILKLPPVYTNKEEVIKKSDNIRPGRFSKEMLIHYRINGLYDNDKYEKYNKYFKYVTTVDDDVCWQIAKEPINSLTAKYPNLISIEEDWEEKLNSIEQDCLDKNIYVYGAGLYGEKVIRKLINDGFGKFIKNIIVTKVDGNMKSIEGISTIGIDDVELDRLSKIIICALPGTSSSIKEELIKRNIGNYIGLFDV